MGRQEPYPPKYLLYICCYIDHKTINRINNRITMEKKPIAIHLKNFLSIPDVPPICLPTSFNC